ncbi:MAG: hypothetical protein JXL20_13690 [Deltaproteobacteria bacterium]|nr:hypothetical protein [Deltaproteobacteria bacterium]
MKKFLLGTILLALLLIFPIPAMAGVKHLESSMKEKVEEMEEKVDELTEPEKEAFQDTKGRLTKAVNTAVHAFK